MFIRKSRAVGCRPQSARVVLAHPQRGKTTWYVYPHPMTNPTTVQCPCWSPRAIDLSSLDATEQSAARPVRSVQSRPPHRVLRPWPSTTVEEQGTCPWVAAACERCSLLARVVFQVIACPHSPCLSTHHLSTTPPQRHHNLMVPLVADASLIQLRPGRNLKGIPCVPYTNDGCHPGGGVLAVTQPPPPRVEWGGCTSTKIRVEERVKPGHPL